MLKPPPNRALVPCLLLAMVASAALCQEPANAPPKSPAAPRSAASWLPADPLLAVELSEGDRLIERFRDFAEDRGCFDGEAYRKLESNPKFMQARVALAGLAATAGVDAWRAAGAILGRDAAMGVWPGTEKRPRMLLAVELREPALFDRLLNAVHALAGLTKNGAPDASRSTEVHGVRVFAMTPELFHCRVNDALLLANDRELLRTALADRQDMARSLASSPRYRKAAAALPKPTVAWALVNLKAVRELIPEGDARNGPRANPIGGFLFGAWWQTLLSSESAVAWLELQGATLRLNATVAAGGPLPAAYKGFSPANISKLDWPASKLPRFISELRICRNWADLIGEREALLTTPAASDIVNFTTTMSTLFNGMDFLNDILPKVDAPLRLIAVRQDFAERDIVPTPQLPAFALVAPLRPDASTDFARRLGAASQTALTLLNLGLTQEGKVSYLIDVDRYKGVKLIFTTFSGPPNTSGMNMDAPEMKAGTGEAAASKPGKIRGAPQVYNFMPATALVGHEYVFATSRELLQDVIDAIQAGSKAAEKADEMADSWFVNGAEIAAILRDNREEMITARMLAENESKEAAVGTIDLILQLVDQLGGLRVTSRSLEREMQATLEVKLAEKQRGD